MKYTRVISRRNGEYLAEHLYAMFGRNDDKIDALRKFLNEYPEHKNCDITLETYDDRDHEDHFKACLASGCVH